MSLLNIRSAEFVVSNTDPGKCPNPDKPEFAFIGRSNVGKSSLINLLVNRKALAKTAAAPGKTQTINHFLVNGEWYLVDLPGYGYASVSKSRSQAWTPMIETYLQKRTNLQTTFILLDPRMDPQAIDLKFIDWMGHEGIPFSLVFTKTDKLKRNELFHSKKKWEETLLKTWSELPLIFETSSLARKGREEILSYLQALLTSD